MAHRWTVRQRRRRNALDDRGHELGVRLRGRRADIVTPAVPDIGLFVGASGLPIPGPDYVEAADRLYVDNPVHPICPDITSFYQATER